MSTSFEVASFEAGLWTVAFRRPDTGKWEPVSDHDSPAVADRRAGQLNGDGSGFVFLRSDRALWTVGEFAGDRFEPYSDHEVERDAAAECARLNGSKVDL